MKYFVLIKYKWYITKISLILIYLDLKNNFNIGLKKTLFL